MKGTRVGGEGRRKRVVGSSREERRRTVKMAWARQGGWERGVELLGEMVYWRGVRSARER